MTRYVKTLEKLGLAPELSRDLERFTALFLRWNSRINLSAARRLDELDEHVIDSLHVIPYIPAGSRVLDVGSGGGFPVVITSICLASCTYTALEPVHKKHAFLRTVARELGLSNLVAIADRLETHQVFDYDVVMSRATFDLREWIERGLEHARPGGLVIGFEALERHDLPNVLRHPYELGGKQRAIVIAQKPRAT